MKRPSIGTRLESILLAGTAIGGVVLSGGVVACMLYVLLTLASLVTVRPAFAQSSPVAPGVRLEAGIEKENVDGDLKSAMDIYQKIAADDTAPRDVRAKALLRLAGCDEKLGKQAKQIYEQIVHDYADQPAAALARNRLASLKKQDNPAMPTTMNVRKIEWAGLGEMTACDTDGHRAVYRAADGDLYFGDLTGQNKRLVFKVQPGDVPVWCLSRDLSMTALGFAAKANRPATLAVIKTDGTGYRELVHDEALGAMFDGSGNFNFDWSWDTRHLVVEADLPDGGVHLIIVDLADGHHRELVHLQKGDIGDAVFSPDGHSIAYSTWQNQGSSLAMRIFVMATEGAEPQQVYQSPWSAQGGAILHQRLHDWTADGRYLLISDAHFGENALYLLPLKSGLAAGNPVFVRNGYIEDAHATASGALVFQEGPAHLHDWRAFHATLESDGKLGPWLPMEIRGGNAGWPPWPSFSPDGARIAYVSGDEEKGGRDLNLRDLATGQEHVLYWFNSGQPFCHYAYDLPKIFCSVGWDDNGGHSDLVSIATESGALERLASFSDYRGFPIPSKDDQRVYFPAQKVDQDGRFVRWETSSRQEDTVVAPRSNNTPAYYVPTPDEHLLIRTDGQGLAIRPTSGGDWRFLVSATDAMLSDPHDALAYGDWVLFDAKDSEGKIRLYRIRLSGGEPQLIGDFPTKSRPEWNGHLQLSRDARQVIAVTKDESKFNLWTLENFEPAQISEKRPTKAKVVTTQGRLSAKSDLFLARIK